jgi:Ubinuclein conserved middle domain
MSFLTMLVIYLLIHSLVCPLLPPPPLATTTAEAKQEKIKGAEAKVGGEESTTVAPPPSARQSTEDAASGMEQDPQPLAPTQEGGTPKATAAAAGKADAHPPSKKYRMTETMKGIVWQLVGLSNDCCRLENEKKCVSSSFFFSFLLLL